MAHAWTSRAARDLPERARGTDSQGRCGFRAGRDLEGSDLCRLRPAGGGLLRRRFGTLRADWATGPNDYRNSSSPGFLFLVVIRSALFATPAPGDSIPADCSSNR